DASHVQPRVGQNLRGHAQHPHPGAGRSGYGARRLPLMPDPIRQLARLVARARRAGHHEPEAMTLATSGRGGRPSARMVLMRGLDARGLAFFTNSRSRKGRELARLPWAAVVFYWPRLRRQVRVEGRIRRLDPAESDAYFATRPREA